MGYRPSGLRTLWGGFLLDGGSYGARATCAMERYPKSCDGGSPTSRRDRSEENPGNALAPNQIYPVQKKPDLRLMKEIQWLGS